jgi:F-box-like
MSAYKPTSSPCASCGGRLGLLARTPSILEFRNSHLTILRSNQILSSDHVQQTRNLVTEAEIELSNHDTEIARLQGAMDELVNRRQELHQCIKETQALLAPVRRIPPEILSHIITLSLPKKWHLEKSGAIALAHSQVCTYWREVVLSMKELWSTIRLNLPPRKHSLAILQSYLWRSENSPLTLILCESQGVMLKQTSAAGFIVDIIAAESSRWKSIDFTLSPTLFSRLSSIRGRLKQLESLKLGVPYQVWTRDLLHSDFDMFTLAPKLCRLHIVNPLVPSVIRIPWKQVTHFSASCMALHIPDLFQNLPQLPDLVSLRIELVYGTQSLQKFPRGNVVLRSLKELAVVGQPDPVSVSRLFSALSVPSVNSISLQYLPMTVPSFGRWLSESTSNVTKLELCYLADLTESILIQCLEATPSLLSFTYKERVGEPIIWTTVVSRRLTIWTQNPVLPTIQSHLLPRLKHMTLSFIRPELDTDDLLQMIESRWKVESLSGMVQARLHSIQLEFRFHSTPSTSTTLARLREFEKEGLWFPC